MVLDCTDNNLDAGMLFKTLRGNLASLKDCHIGVVFNLMSLKLLFREPVIGLIKWLRPKGLKVCSYAEKCAKFKNQTLKKIGWYTKVLCATEYPRGMQYLKNSAKMGVPLQVILETI